MKKLKQQTVKKKIRDIIGDIAKVRERAISELAEMDKDAFQGSITKLIKEKRKQMHEAADNLDFETAALIRDEIQKLESSRSKKPQKAK